MRKQWRRGGVEGLLLEQDLTMYWLMREDEAQRLDQGVRFLQTVVGTYNAEHWVRTIFLCGSMSKVHFWTCYD